MNIFKTRLSIFIKIGISTLILIFLSTKINYNILEKEFYLMDKYYIFLSTIFLILGMILVSLKQNLILNSVGKKFDFFTIFTINLSSRFYSIPMPAMLGAQLVSWIRFYRKLKKKSLFNILSLFERLNFFYSIVIISIINYLVIIKLNLQNNILKHESILFFLISLFIIYIIFRKSILIKFAKIFFKIFKKKKNKELFVFLNKKFINFDNYLILLNCIWFIFYLIRVIFLTSALDINFAISIIILISSLNLLIQSIPITISGIGLREYVFSNLFVLYGASFEKGIIVALILFLQIIIVSLFGVLLDICNKYFKKKNNNKF